MVPKAIIACFRVNSIIIVTYRLNRTQIEISILYSLITKSPAVVIICNIINTHSFPPYRRHNCTVVRMPIIVDSNQTTHLE